MTDAGPGASRGVGRGACLLLLGLAALAGSAAAQRPCAGALSSEQILGCLAGPKTRGFPGLGRGIAVEGASAPAEETAVDLTVGFEFNSATLDNDGIIALDALGRALSDPALRDGRFRIAGHTDAVGSDGYNQTLSQARAAAVLAYLLRRFQLDPARFEALGFGKSQLLDAGNPMAAANRRVQVTKLAR